MNPSHVRVVTLYLQKRFRRLRRRELAVRVTWIAVLVAEAVALAGAAAEAWSLDAWTGAALGIVPAVVLFGIGLEAQRRAPRAYQIYRVLMHFRGLEAANRLSFTSTDPSLAFSLWRAIEPEDIRDARLLLEVGKTVTETPPHEAERSVSDGTAMSTIRE